MPLQIIDCEQGSPEWNRVRCKKVTSSRFKDVMAQGQGKTRAGYLHQLVGERLTGQVDMNGYYDKNMRWGNETEPQARATYMLESDALSVRVPGFCQLNSDVGASTDGLVDADGMLEIKCPLSKTHIATILGGKVPTQHIVQIQGGLWVTGRKWCDFVSFDPRMNVKNKMSYFCIRVFRDEEKIKKIEAEVNIFTAELRAMIRLLAPESLKKELEESISKEKA